MFNFEQMAIAIGRHFVKVLVGLLLVALAGCTATTEQGAFDFETQRTGSVDKKGFPVFVGGKYDRKVPLKPTIERARLDAELQALGDSRKRTGSDIEAQRAELSQQRLQTIARTHGDEARAEIAAACKEQEDGEIVCKGD
ncbi:MAG: hypothetical protein ABJN04_13945 [Hyphomicrobiales bacterium]